VRVYTPCATVAAAVALEPILLLLLESSRRIHRSPILGGVRTSGGRNLLFFGRHWPTVSAPFACAAVQLAALCLQ